MVKGGEPDTLHSISADFPTTVLQSFNFLENVGGMILSVREGNRELVLHTDNVNVCSVMTLSMKLQIDLNEELCSQIKLLNSRVVECLC